MSNYKDNIPIIIVRYQKLALKFKIRNKINNKMWLVKLVNLLFNKNYEV